MTDTIDRDELLRELTKRRKKAEHDRNLGSGFYRQGYIGGFYKQGYMDGYDDAIKAIDSILPADVETDSRNTWEIAFIQVGNRHRIITCPICDYSEICDERLPDHCPECGAKMEDKNA